MLGVQIDTSEQSLCFASPRQSIFKMFKLIYTADLHGNEEFYKRLLKKAEDENVDAIAIGGDLCPRIGNTTKEKINNQKIFLEKFIIPFFKDFKQKNIQKEIYMIMGNDD